jgi:hypothetical protein
MPSVIPILILNAYHIPMMGTVMNHIHLLVIEGIHIPPVSHICVSASMWENQGLDEREIG